MNSISVDFLAPSIRTNNEARLDDTRKDGFISRPKRKHFRPFFVIRFLFCRRYAPRKVSYSRAVSGYTWFIFSARFFCQIKRVTKLALTRLETTWKDYSKNLNEKAEQFFTIRHSGESCCSRIASDPNTRDLSFRDKIFCWTKRVTKLARFAKARESKIREELIFYYPFTLGETLATQGLYTRCVLIRIFASLLKLEKSN